MQIIVFLRFEDPRRESARVCKYAYGIVCARNVYELFSVLSVASWSSRHLLLLSFVFLLHLVLILALPSVLLDRPVRNILYSPRSSRRDRLFLPPPSIIPPLHPPSPSSAKALSNLLIFFASPMGLAHTYIDTVFSSVNTWRALDGFYAAVLAADEAARRELSGCRMANYACRRRRKWIMA